MDLIAFLTSLVAGDAEAVAATAVVVGAVVWGVIHMLDNAIPDGMTKFLVSLGLAYGVPIGAYVGLQLLTNHPIVLNGLFLASSVGWTVAQTIHRTAKTVAENKKV